MYDFGAEKKRKNSFLIPVCGYLRRAKEVELTGIRNEFFLFFSAPKSYKCLINVFSFEFSTFRNFFLNAVNAFFKLSFQLLENLFLAKSTMSLNSFHWFS